jgi:WD40 repeat protein
LKQRVEMGELLGPQGSVASLAYSPRYRLLAAGCFDTTARVWTMSEEVSVEALDAAGPPEPVSVRVQAGEKR